MAKNIFYWPGINSDIINLTENCMICHKFNRCQIKQNLLNHYIPKSPFLKIGMDIADYKGTFYLVIIDYYLRWLEILKIKQKDTATIISKLKPLFCKFGIPLKDVADNIPFGSAELFKFANEWNFEIKNSYPKSNGLSEKGIGIAKK